MDDNTVTKLTQTPDARAWDEAVAKYSTMYDSSTSHKITPELVVKRANAAEYAGMLYVRSHTRIPVPQPRYPHLHSWLVMDLVDGTMLLECWESLSWWMKFRVACTLRGYVRQLRALKGTRPGSVLDGVITSHALFDNARVGPFEDAAQFQSWCEWIVHSSWVRWARSLRYDDPSAVLEDPYPFMGAEWPLVFTHSDLNLTNIMLSKDGVLWVIDWANSGFFPPWLETVGLRYCRSPASFARYINFISGSFPEQEDFWGWFMDEVHHST